jgi:hypothetical protein
MGLVKAIVFFLVAVSLSTVVDEFVKRNERRIGHDGVASKYLSKGMIALYIMTLLVALF